MEHSGPFCLSDDQKPWYHQGPRGRQDGLFSLSRSKNELERKFVVITRVVLHQ